MYEFSNQDASDQARNMTGMLSHQWFLCSRALCEHAPDQMGHVLSEDFLLSVII